MLFIESRASPSAIALSMIIQGSIQSWEEHPFLLYALRAHTDDLPVPLAEWQI